MRFLPGGEEREERGWDWREVGESCERGVSGCEESSAVCELWSEEEEEDEEEDGSVSGFIEGRGVENG